MGITTSVNIHLNNETFYKKNIVVDIIKTIDTTETTNFIINNNSLSLGVHIGKLKLILKHLVNKNRSNDLKSIFLLPSVTYSILHYLLAFYDPKEDHELFKYLLKNVIKQDYIDYLTVYHTNNIVSMISLAKTKQVDCYMYFLLNRITFQNHHLIDLCRYDHYDLIKYIIDTKRYDDTIFTSTEKGSAFIWICSKKYGSIIRCMLNTNMNCIYHKTNEGSTGLNYIVDDNILTNFYLDRIYELMAIEKELHKQKELYNIIREALELACMQRNQDRVKLLLKKFTYEKHHLENLLITKCPVNCKKIFKKHITNKI
jgi:hypothetical protein